VRVYQFRHSRGSKAIYRFGATRHSRLPTALRRSVSLKCRILAAIV
jgi:hypothetical protein